jgi:hypothetical protein
MRRAMHETKQGKKVGKKSGKKAKKGTFYDYLFG